MSLLPLFLTITLLLPPALATRDIIIVGAGTSGCALAARLCASLPSLTFTLLERGAPRNRTTSLAVRVPRNQLAIWADAPLAEAFPSLPNPGLLGARETVATGNTLGGSSAINGMQWTVPQGPAPVDRWRVRGLSAARATRFYRRAYRAVGFHRENAATRQVYTNAFIRAAGAAGFRRRFAPFDYEARREIWPIAVATRKGRRSDSCSAYLTPVLNGACRDNLQLIQSATVTRVLLSKGRRPRATGVEYVHSNDKLRKAKNIIRASKEVILAAGPFGSPKLLQLSGIGPRKHLRSVGVRTHVDLPVGERTQARAFAALLTSYPGMPLEPSNNSTVLSSDETLRKWRAGEDSVLGTTGFATHAVLGSDAYITMATALARPDGEIGLGNLDSKEMSSACITTPESFGFLRIAGRDPFSPPSVHTNVLGEQTEADTMKRCLLAVNNTHNQLPERFKAVRAIPQDGQITEEYVRKASRHAFHFVGGCRVGDVVKDNLNVKGVRGLRVVDASVLSSMPAAAGPLASTYMLAEYVAEKLAEVYTCVGRDAGKACGKLEKARAKNGWRK